MRVLVVYDCLFPHTVGGAERWYRNLALRLAGDGHEVSYLTMRQWERGAHADLPGVRVHTAAPRMALYAAAGRRRIAPPLIFGAGVLWHLLRHGDGYDVVHTASFPYFSLLAAGFTRRVHGHALVVDWHEVWSAQYWAEYLGTAGGRVGHAVQRRCARLPQRAFCFSRLHGARLRSEGLRGEVTVLEGEYDGPLAGRDPLPAREEVVFAGRHIPEKRAPALVPALAEARRRLPGLRARILGDGPERAQVQRLVREHGLDDAVDVPGFVSAAELDEALAGALAMVLPSRREGYGQVVVQAAAVGTPSIVSAAPDNAAVELVVDGVNGVVAPDAEPVSLADAILRVHAGGPALRRSTAAWFAANAHRLSVAGSLDIVVAAYGSESARS